jgi:predicted nucleotidyltransferase
MHRNHKKNKGALQMDNPSILLIAKEYAVRVSRLFPVKKIFLYGSAARGTSRAESDIDIAVIVDRLDGDFLDSEIRLYRIRRDLDDRIEPILIDMETDKSGFIDEIEKTGLLLYG